MGPVRVLLPQSLMGALLGLQALRQLHDLRLQTLDPGCIHLLRRDLWMIKWTVLPM